MDQNTRGYALSLSGGGTRATAFHLGVMVRLAVENRLERISAISSVSGGSLAVGLIFSAAGLRWPSSRHFLASVLPAISATLTETSLQRVTFQRAASRPWMLARSRGNLFADAIKRAWNISGTMKQLPATPRWLANATCFDTGRNWRFSQTHIGDWKFGHNYEQSVDIATAMAASAAIPYLAGFVRLSIDASGWFQIDPATDKPLRAIEPKSTAVRLWDGGVYENLGLEGLYKPQRGLVSAETDFVIVSDASAHFAEEFAAASGIFTTRFPYLRPPRLFDIASEQVRSLRSRLLIDAIGGGRLRGALIRLGRSVRYIDESAGRQNQSGATLDEAVVERLARYPTDATAMALGTFCELLRHGFETANATLLNYAPDEFAENLAWRDDFVADIAPH